MTETAPARRPTMMEVAKLASVSHQTVSRYFRFNGGLKPDTVARIDAAVKELNYRPNLVARSMRTRKTGRVALLVPALAYNPARMLHGATATAHQAGYSVEVLSLEGDIRARTARLLELSDSGQVEGILSLVSIPRSVEDEVAQSTTITVSADFDDEFRGIGELADGSPVATLIDGLADLGHRRFLHVAGSQDFASARGRKQTYLDTIDRLGLDSAGVVEGDWSGASGVEAMRAVDGAHPPTAVIAANDLVAAGVVRGALERGWSVPRDLSVTGWDDTPIGQFYPPSLTTVDVDLEQLGSRAMTRLIAALRGETPEIPGNSLHRVIWRESTAAPPTLA